MQSLAPHRRVEKVDAFVINVVLPVPQYALIATAVVVVVVVPLEGQNLGSEQRGLSALYIRKPRTNPISNDFERPIENFFDYHSYNTSQKLWARSFWKVSVHTYKNCTLFLRCIYVFFWYVEHQPRTLIPTCSTRNSSLNPTIRYTYSFILHELFPMSRYTCQQ